MQTASVRDNLCLAALRRIAPHGWITRRMERPYVEANIRELQIKVASPGQPVSSLSGGNQQKVVLGNWLNTRPRVLLLDEPSRGVDVAARQQIFQIIWGQAAQGVSSIVVSTELEELLQVCDRILVLRDGRIQGELDPAATDAKALYAACMAPGHGPQCQPQSPRPPCHPPAPDDPCSGLPDRSAPVEHGPGAHA